MTPNDIIRQAIWNSGAVTIAQTIYAEEVYAALITLNTMLSQFSRKRFLVYHLVDIACIANGNQSYQVGPGLDFDVTRPDSIEAAYARLLGPPEGISPFDVPLGVIPSYEDYSNIGLKSLISFPMAVFYDASVPSGTLYVYPTPPAGQYEIHVIVKETLPQFTDLTTPIVLPPEYSDALIWNLAVRLRPLLSQLPADPMLTAMATSTLNVIRGANQQIPKLSMPAGIGGVGGRYLGHGIPGYGSIS